MKNFYKIIFIDIRELSTIKKKVWTHWSAFEANRKIDDKSSYFFLLGLLPCKQIFLISYSHKLKDKA